MLLVFLLLPQFFILPLFPQPSLLLCLNPTWLPIARVLAGQFSPMINGFGLANTSVALFGGYLFALGESDLPYAIKLTQNGEIITLGRHAFYSNPFLNMTAHPKIDPNTGEAFAFGYDIFPPFLTYFRINEEGIKQDD
ncbi:putative carotenoid cleavage dioxygenase 4 [Abeliophyllum distichum]|uniref:Carotenoid cleavage dioxygenase 4 n=1 Tax=Abeliophyllum distichum TaxID=126358 RepID=A0ABD1TX53_9LAMI